MSLSHGFCPIPLILCSFTMLYGQSYPRDIKPILVRFCGDCHSGDEPEGDVDLLSIASSAEARSAFEVWAKVDELLEQRKMPPEDQPQPSDEEVALLRQWYQTNFVESAEAHPGVFRPRRLSAHEYRNTLRSLFGFDLEVNVVEAEQTITETSLVLKLLPVDPPGASGFRNDTHRNPISTATWEQYAYLADVAIEQLFSLPRRDQLVAMAGELPNGQFQSENASRLLRHFVPRAVRRPLREAELQTIVQRVTTHDDVQAATKRELKRWLTSPTFLYRGLLMPRPLELAERANSTQPHEAPNDDQDRTERRHPGQMPVDAFELAERISYFLWADMPDEELMACATDGRLLQAETLRAQVDRMLNSPRAHSLAIDFAVEWLLLDQIEQVSDNPPVMVALQSQPIDFFQYLIAEDRPLMELIDSRVTFANPLTRKYYLADGGALAAYRRPKGIEIEIVPNQKLRLENTPERGGILTMPGVLAMNRGPILRGVWILERILGEHLPDPPANVGPVKANIPGQELSFRERFAEHRANQRCALCHDKIDPLGFALDSYDDSGGYRGDSGQGRRRKKVATSLPAPTIDTSGQLPSGETFQDFAELKQILLTTQCERITGNIVQRMLSYALCRKLELNDKPTVDDIVMTMLEENGTWRGLIFEIVDSLPFRETIVLLDQRNEPDSDTGPTR